MHCILERDALSAAVGWAARALPTRPPVPVLAGLLLTIDNESMTAAAFDYEISATATVAATSDDTWQALVPGRLLAEIATRLPAAPVRLDFNGSAVPISCGQATFTLLAMPREDYPKLPDMPPTAFTIAASELATTVAASAIAAGRDSTIPALTGVRLVVDRDVVSCSATDRYRIGHAQAALERQTADPIPEALVPAAFLTQIATRLPGDAPVDVAIGPQLLGVHTGGYQATTRLLDGHSFPNLSKYWPTEFTSEAIVDGAALADTVRRVAIVAERNTPVRLHLTTGRIELAAATGEEAQATESLPADYRGDGDLDLAFNPQFLLDALTATQVGTPISMQVAAPTKPVVLSPVRSSEEEGTAR